MSMFTLAIFCLTTSNLPWFMILIFQVPMQYCSILHGTLISSPDTFTIEHHFCFGPASSFPLELLVFALHSFPVQHTECLLTWGFILQCHIFLPFLTVYGVLQTRILKLVAISFPSGPYIVSTLHYDPCILGDSVYHGWWLHWIVKTPLSLEGCDPFQYQTVLISIALQ